MTILTFPDIIAPAQVSWRLRALTQTHSSPFDGTTQTLSQPGARWVATLTWATLNLTQRRQMEAFVASLQGRAGRFYYGPIHAPRRAAGTGTVTVNGNSQTGSTFNTQGWAASAEAFKAGDFFSYADAGGRRRLHMVTADVSANGSGVCIAAITPPIRVAGLDGDPVEIADPSGVFMLAEDEVAMLTRPPLLGSVTLEIMEALA
jgi:hypothetical protein